MTLDAAGSPMIVARDLHKSYGKVEVLKGMSCEIAASEVVCLIGPSGSGKSTCVENRFSPNQPPIQSQHSVFCRAPCHRTTDSPLSPAFSAGFPAERDTKSTIGPAGPDLRIGEEWRVRR